MAVSEKAIEFLGNSLATGKAIPGQSLTNSPEQPYKWEKPSEFTNSKEASLYIFETITVPETTTNLLLSVINGVGVIDLASIILYSGFLEGKWNPDLMALLMEPTMYMIMALAEKADIDYEVEAGNKEKPKEMSGDKSVKILQSGINELDKIKNRAINKINQQSIPQEVRDIIKEKELSPDLLKQVEGKTQPKSLLGKEE